MDARIMKLVSLLCLSTAVFVVCVGAREKRKSTFQEIAAARCSYVELVGRRNSNLRGFNHFGLVLTCSNGFWLAHGSRGKPVLTYITIMSHRWVVVTGYPVNETVGSYFSNSVKFAGMSNLELAMKKALTLPGIPIIRSDWQVNFDDNGFLFWYKQKHFATENNCVNHQLNRLQYFKTTALNVTGVHKVSIAITYVVKGCNNVVHQGCSGSVEVYGIRAESGDISRIPFFNVSAPDTIKLDVLIANYESISNVGAYQTMTGTIDLNESHYLAIGLLDKGVCIRIHNITVSPYQCKKMIRKLAHYGHLLSPRQGITKGSGVCVENALPKDGSSLEWSCSALGDASYGEGCTCKKGFDKSNKTCLASISSPVLLNIVNDVSDDASKDTPKKENKTMVLVAAVSGGIVLILVGMIGVFLIRRQKKRNDPLNFAQVVFDPEDLTTQYSVRTAFLEGNTRRGKKSIYSELSSRITEVPKLEEHPVYEKVDHYEFPSTNLKLLQELGEGCFGTVYLGEACNISGWSGISYVAVKTLKESAKLKYGEAFLFELDLLRHLGPHENVVRLLGCCTEHGPTRIIFEFVERGDLRTLLRSCVREGCDGNISTLPFSELLNFAWMIAKGMHFIAQNQIVHRDLAARNILVDHNLVCKVSDFGLARYLNDNSIYQKGPEQARLPLEWMAPESIFRGTYSVKSDVWSFGILLWELMSQGDNPYPEYQVHDVKNLLAENYRMACPKGCPKEMYHVMMLCWAQEESKRPDFAELVDTFNSNGIWLKVTSL